jgi:hypothetical protein
MAIFWEKRPHFCPAVLEVFHFFLRKPSLRTPHVLRILENAA